MVLAFLLMLTVLTLMDEAWMRAVLAFLLTLTVFVLAAVESALMLSKLILMLDLLVEA